MRGSIPNEVEVNEERSSRAGETVCRKGPGSTSRMKRGKSREREEQEKAKGGSYSFWGSLPPLLLPHRQRIVLVSLHRIHDRMSTRSLPEFPIRLMLEPGIDAHLLLGGICREGPDGGAPGDDLLHHGILTIRDLGR